ncbi:MAG: zinc-ribbon domain-containing protein [Candidatus Hodarchaeota archaeon]
MISIPNFCTNCGNPLQPSWKVCPICGKSIYVPVSPITTTEISSRSTSSTAEPSVSMKKEQKHITKKKIKIIVIAACIIVAAVVIPITVFFTTNCYRTINYYVSHGQITKSYTCIFPRSTYNYYANQPHPRHDYVYYDWDDVALTFASYCTPDESEILKIAQEIKSQCINQSNDEEIINALLSFAQGITYKSDPLTVDRAKYPLETLMDKGDCEDLSIFFGSIVESLGYEAVILCVIVDDPLEGPFGHACVGVHLNFTPSHHVDYPIPGSYFFDAAEDSNQYWLCETTDQGWMVGQLPASDPSDFSIVSYAFVN